MTCPDLEAVEAMLNGECPPDAAALLEQHLSSCEACQAIYGSLIWREVLCQSAAAELPSLAAVGSSVHRRAGIGRDRLRSSRQWILAARLVAGLGLAIHLGGRPDIEPRTATGTADRSVPRPVQVLALEMSHSRTRGAGSVRRTMRLPAGNPMRMEIQVERLVDDRVISSSQQWLPVAHQDVLPRSP